MKSSTAIAELPTFKTRAIRLSRQRQQIRFRYHLTKWAQVGRPAIAPLAGHVRFGSKTDIASDQLNVRFTPKAGIGANYSSTSSGSGSKWQFCLMLLRWDDSTRFRASGSDEQAPELSLCLPAGRRYRSRPTQ